MKTQKSEGNTKHCNKCGKDLAATKEHWYPSQLKGAGRAHCKACTRVYMRGYTQTPKAKLQRAAYAASAEVTARRRAAGQTTQGQAASRNAKFLRNYGLTLAAYDVRLAEQAGVCAICRQPETARWRRTGRTKTLAVDHNHVTGSIRGLLCHKCNFMIGLADDDVARLQAAVAYLERVDDA